MQSKALQLLLLIPFLAAGCSTQVEVSTEIRTPSEVTESAKKFSTKVGISLLADQEDPAPVSDDSPVPTEQTAGKYAQAAAVSSLT